MTLLLKLKVFFKEIVEKHSHYTFLYKKTYNIIFVQNIFHSISQLSNRTCPVACPVTVFVVTF